MDVLDCKSVATSWILDTFIFFNVFRQTTSAVFINVSYIEARNVKCDLIYLLLWCVSRVVDYEMFLLQRGGGSMQH